MFVRARLNASLVLMGGVFEMRFSLFKILFRNLKRNVRLSVTALIVFAFFLMLFEQWFSTQKESMRARESVLASNYANVLKIRIDRELNALLLLSNGIAGYLSAYHDDLDKRKIDAVLAGLHEKAKHIRNFGIAVGYKIKYVYPLKSNEKALNIDYRNLPMQLPSFQKAIETRQPVLIGPVDLVQGGSGFIYRYPIYIDNQYWGMISTVIDRDSFLSAAFDHQLNGQYEFATRYSGVQQQNKKLLFGDDRLFDNPEAFVTKSDVPNGQWEWAIVDRSQDSQKLISILRVMGWVLSFFLAAVLFFLLIDRQLLAKKATRDALTGLANRELLQDSLLKALSFSAKHQSIIALMFIDIDYFKKVNDTHGHDVGDEVLKAVSEKILNTIRLNDIVCRVGGDEFVVLLNDLNTVDESLSVAEKLAISFVAPVEIGDHIIPINLSIGIATPLSAEETPGSLMKKADIALYEAKRSGRNQFVIYKAEQ